MLTNLQVNQPANGYVAVKKSSVGTSRNGSKFLDLQLTDGTETIAAKMWDVQEAEMVPKVDTVIKIEATVSEYQGNKQLILSRWRDVEPGECDPGQFIPVCPANKDDMLRDLKWYIEDTSDPCYKLLLTNIFQGEIYDKFITAPGAKGIHHAYLGGLLEHSLGVCDLTLAMKPDGLNVDLLLTGALIHDIGKIAEYDWSGCVIKRTDAGKLLGHIVLGLQIITTTATAIGMNKDKLMALYHLIASHHGKLEWGSPVEPMTAEAIILHQADILDYQMHVFDAAKNKTIETDPKSKWTDKVSGIGRKFWIG